MDPVGASQSQKINRHIVETIINQEAVLVTQLIACAVIRGHAEHLDVLQLAKKHIRVDSGLSECDEKTKMVYTKLFIEANKLILANSLPVLKTFYKIDEITRSDISAGKFLGAFVLPAARGIVDKLRSNFPETLENPELWAPIFEGLECGGLTPLS